MLLTDVGDVTGNHKNWDAAGQSDIIQVENEEFRGFDNTHINSTPQGYYVVNGPVGFCWLGESTVAASNFFRQ